MSNGVAIIGISGLYPEAASVAEFYRNLCRGLDSIRPLPEERAALCGLAERSRLLAAIDRIDEFDNEFFNISPKEAEYTDPQQRWLLLLACAAIENAGYSLGDFRGSQTAVIFSASNNDYRRLFDGGPAEPTAVTGNLPAALAGRTAYALDLQGPALVIDTACSSSLVAIYEASRKVLNGEVDYALAGGINFFYLEDALGGADIGIMAPDGKAKAFDDSANGTGFGEGGGVVLLKRLDRALADRDHIHAVIKGGAVNQDGGRSNGLTAPSPQAQGAVILRAWQNAGVAPETIRYIEAHGTGTKLGDPIEIQGITDAFRKFTDRKQFCYLSSVKTNIGHLVAAAGIAGLTKCVLSLRHKKLFPSLHFHKPNSLIDFEHSPVVVNTELRDWERLDEQTPLRCGISSFGLSGTNVHLVLEEPPVLSTPSSVLPEELITLSAKSPAALLRYVEALRQHLQTSTASLADVAYTLNVGRDVHPFRYACVVRSKEELIEHLRVQGGSDWFTEVRKPKPVVFLFSGNAEPTGDVCDELAQRHAVFAEHYQQCLDLIGGRNGNQAARSCSFQFALYHLWRSCEISTDKLVGTGSGNKAVAILTGRLSLSQGLEEALQLTQSAPLDLERLKTVIEQMAQTEVPLFLEMGTAGVLCDAVGSLGMEVVPSFEAKSGSSLVTALARLYLGGAAFSMKPLYKGLLRQRVELPGYQFEKKRFWVNVPAKQAASTESVAVEKEAETPTVDNSTPVEQRLASIWTKVLGLDEVGPTDDYFELGGDSLSGTQLTNAIVKEFGVSVDFEDIYTYSTIESLSQRIVELFEAEKPAAVDTLLPLVPLPRPEQLPLSSGQLRLWFLHELEPENAFYNIPVSLRLKGRLEVSLLERCLQEIVTRHEILRTVFIADEGRPAQVIKEEWPVSIPIVELHHLAADEREPKAQSIATDDARRPFVLSEGPLFRVTLIKLAEADHLLQLTMHHVISDGWSIALLVHEFAELYQALSVGDVPNLPELRVQYADYSCWQQQWLESEIVREQLTYWKQQLGGTLPILELPTDRPRLALSSYRGARHDFNITPELTARLHELAQRESVTLFMLLLGAFQVLLARHTGEDDIIVGSPIAGRNRAEVEKLIGFFTNTLVFRSDLNGDPAFVQLLQAVKRIALEAYANQDVPFEILVEELQPKRLLNQTPLFQVMFVLQNISVPVHELPDLSMEVSEPDRETAKFDVTLFLMERDDGMAGRLEYRTELFDQLTIERMVGHFLVMLEAIVADPACRLSALPLLTLPERQQLEVWNQTSVQTSLDLLVHRLFEQQAALYPDRLAVIAEGGNLTFAQLNERSNQLAHHLRAKGVGPEVRVALLLDRSAEMIVSVLAILKAGGAYVPIDAAYPEWRIDFMLADAGVDILLVANNAFAPGRVTARMTIIHVDGEGLAHEPSANPSWPVADLDLAYVIYTSGTTGRPRGVMIQHRSVVNLFYALEQAIYSSVTPPPSRVGINASMGFDSSIKQLIQVLAGRTLCLVPEDIRTDPAELLAYLNRNQVDVVDCTPAIARFLLTEKYDSAYPSVVLVGGEAIDAATWAELAAQEGRTYFNVYGPTECTVDSTQSLVQLNSNPTIGRPLSNMQVHILDQSGRPVPVGVIGELYIGGAGVARGYWGRPELTAERFVPNPFATEAGARLYRTGDLGRYRESGEIEFLGRADRQVKVRGHRIELGEVESVLEEHEAVAAAAVVTRVDGVNVRLVGYVVRKEDAQSEANGWEQYIKERLPEAMRPWLVREVSALPLTANGKVNRAQLEEWARGEQRVESGEERARGTESEELLRGIWEEVLGVAGIGVHDNFFDLGGDSILSIQIVAKSNQAGLNLKPRDLFQHQTISELASVAQTGVTVEAEQGIVTGMLPLTPIQHWFFEQSLTEPHHWNQAVLIEVRRRLDPRLLAEVVSELDRHHDALRLRFRRSDDGWQQVNDGWSNVAGFSCEDLSELSFERQREELESRAARLQASLNLERGPLWRVILFECGSEQLQRLLLIAHHLVVDGISWRILLDDLRKGYEYQERGVEISLGRKTTSFKRWAEELQRQAQLPDYDEDRSYWLKQEGRPVLVTDFDGGDNTEQQAQAVQVYLTKDETHDLLHRVQTACRAQINELLLTALVQAWSRWGQAGSLYVAVEGHGREHLDEALDTSRTVGWFTKIFPVRLETGFARDPDQALRRVQETLQRIPHEGLGFGLLRYMNQSLRDVPLPEISFNYLGQFDHLLPDDGWFALAEESVGPMHSPVGSRPYKLELGAGVAVGTMQLICRYSEDMFRRASMETLVDHWLTSLRELISYYCDGAPDPLLEDLTDEHLTPVELSNILTQISNA